MRCLLVVVAATAAMIASPSLGDDRCNLGSGDALTVSEWSIKPIDAANNMLSVTLQSYMTKDVRMIDASVSFVDALGGPIASFSLDRDAQIEAGGTYSEENRWGPNTFERLLDIKQEDAIAYGCVRSVLYGDGTKDEF